MTTIKHKLSQSEYETLTWTKYEGFYGYFVVTIDMEVVFFYQSGDELVYDDVTEQFFITK